MFEDLFPFFPVLENVFQKIPFKCQHTKLFAAINLNDILSFSQLKQASLERLIYGSNLVQHIKMHRKRT